MSQATPTAEEITSLLESSAYSAESIPQLAAYVQAQASGAAPYSFAANRALTKLYQIFPDKEDESTIARVLLLSLLEFPSTDLLALSCLIPERVQTSGSCEAVLRCFDLLDSCQFAAFWTAFDALKEGSDETFTSLAARATEKLSKSIAGVLALSYRSAAASMVVAACNVKSADALASYESVERVEGDSVTFVATAENTKRDRVFQEGVGFDAISSLMTKAAVARE